MNNNNQSTESAAKSADGRASVTFGPRCSEPLSRSELLSWLRSDSAAGLGRSKKILLHCSDTWPSANFTIEKLAASHRARGFGQWPGYHFYVTRDGTIYYCRPIGVRGCHAKGYNEGSIGVCYEGGRKEECKGWHRKGSSCELCGQRGCHCPKGLRVMSPWEDNRTAEQVVALHELLSTLLDLYPNAQLLGHRDLPGVRKACPCLDTRREYGYLRGMRVEG